MSGITGGKRARNSLSPWHCGSIYMKHLKYKHTTGPVKHISKNLSIRNNQMIYKDNPLFLT